MRIGELLKMMVRAFFLIATGTVASMYVFCLAFNPDAVFTVRDIGRILLMAAASVLTLVLFYSGTELDRRRMLLRKALHLPVLCALLLWFAFRWDWVSPARADQIAVFLLLVLGIYAAVSLMILLHNRKLTERINRRLHERYHS
jgi:hypothetical protein